jgi:flagellar motor switch protein FliG
VAITGIHKAAILLMSLDATTASELLKGLPPDTVTNIAVELAYLDATGFRAREHSFAVAKDFCDTLKKNTGGTQIKKFLGKMLESSVGAKKAGEIQLQMDDMVKKRDPFIQIRSASTEKLAYALQGEHPQAAALVLSELSPKKSTEVLGLLSSDLQQKAVRRMTNPEYISPETKLRIASLILKRIEPAPAGAPAQRDAAISQVETQKAQRKLAILLRGLAKELRDGLIGSIKQNNEEAAQMVGSLMVTWEDIPAIQDRPLQESLRSIESQKLAKGLIGADAKIVKKIRANISERAASLLDEETSLLSSPKKEDIQAARDEIVMTLRQMNEEGKLAFAEE